MPLVFEIVYSLCHATLAKVEDKPVDTTSNTENKENEEKEGEQGNGSASGKNDLSDTHFIIHQHVY